MVFPRRDDVGQLHERHGNVPVVEIPLFPQEVRGVARLRTAGRLLAAAADR
jgi:hypothetical protein